MSSTDDVVASYNDDTTTESISAYLVMFALLLAIVLVLSKLLQDHAILASVFPEAGMVLLVGIVASFFVNLVADTDNDGNEQQQVDDAVEDENLAENLLSFSPEMFFVVLLPPIIFNSGYHLRKELFFRHITPICLFAVVGTLVSALTIAFFLYGVVKAKLTGDFLPTLTELLTFGALISATDPVSTLAVFQAKRVDPQLFYLVFGESVLNDAVGLVLFQAFRRFVVLNNQASEVAVGMTKLVASFLFDSVLSPLLGLVCGCAAALLFKCVDMRKRRLLELCLYVLIMYVPFLLAQACRLSGIVTILFTGMAARAYVVPNLSTATAANADLLFRLAAHLAETSIFLELGLSVFGLRGSLNGRFLLWSLLACLLGRTLNVYPITFVFNRHVQRGTPLVTDDDDWQQQPTAISSSRRKQQRRGSQKNEGHVEMSEMLTSSCHHPAVAEQGEINQQLRDKNNNALAAAADGALDTVSTATSTTPVVRRDLKINPPTANMLWFSGLRGAVAYACVRSFPDTFGHQREFIMTTMGIVLVTVFALGSTTECMLNCLHIEMNIDEDRYMEDWYSERQSLGLIRRFDEFVKRIVVRQAPESGIPAAIPDQEKPIDDTSCHSTTSESSYMHHVDVAESEHLESKKKVSLFDYGFNCD